MPTGDPILIFRPDSVTRARTGQEVETLYKITDALFKQIDPATGHPVVHAKVAPVIR